MLKSRIENAKVTVAFPGNPAESIVIDRDLLKLADIWPYERVEVCNIDTGARFFATALPFEAGSGVVAVHGAILHLARPGHRINIVSSVVLSEADLPRYSRRVVQVDDQNRALASLPNL